MTVPNLLSHPDLGPGILCIWQTVIPAAFRRFPVAPSALHLAEDWLLHHAEGNAAADIMRMDNGGPVELRFPCGAPHGLFPGSLRQTYRELIALQDDREPVCLLYLHMGHQSECKTPILQKLLQALDHRGPAYAIRVRSHDITPRDWAFLRTLLETHRHCVLINDPTERLAFAESQPSASLPITLTLFARTPDLGVGVPTDNALASAPFRQSVQGLDPSLEECL